MTSSPDSHVRSTSHEQFLYWFMGLFPIVTSAVTPLTTWRKVLAQNTSHIQKYNDLVHEVGRQFVSGTIGLVTYFGGGELAQALANKVWQVQGAKNPPLQNRQDHKHALIPHTPTPLPTNNSEQESLKNTLMIVGGAVLNFIGFAFIRPAVSIDIIHAFRKPTSNTPAPTPPPITHRLPENPSKWLQLKAKWLQWKTTGTQVAIHWVDQTFFTNGHPHLGKAAISSALGLTGYLGALSLGIYGMTKGIHALFPSLSQTKQVDLNPTPTPKVAPPRLHLQASAPEINNRTFGGISTSQTTPKSVHYSLQNPAGRNALYPTSIR